MRTTWKNKKLLSKFWRLKLSSELREVIGALPLTGMRESQVGAYVYSGNGSMEVGTRTVQVVLRARIVDGGVQLVLSSPSGLRAEFPLERLAALAAVDSAVRRMAN